MQATQTPDAILIDRFKKGDQAAMDTLVNRHRPRAYAYAMRLSHDHEMADDVVADTFVRVNRAAATFKGQSAFSTWLHTLTKNCYLDLRKKALLRVTESLDRPFYVQETGIERQFESTALTPHDRAECSAQADALAVAVGKLPPKQRTLIVMFHVEMLAYEEIADQLHIPVGTIKSRLHRARAVLRHTLDPDRFLLGVDAAYMA
jgi:RNA polymerase sigma-70 factor (ECF subfamily)